ncbi:MAG: gliding motility-associated C-terminal domain-containing protein [Bacteroidetes bacterium]|nr:gliding motility-associated C-terminal domain-containing protein [Bacteroidota bacterium]
MDDVSHYFLKPGKLNICLTAYNIRNCPATACYSIQIDTGLWIPNVFTPGNNDGFNDHYVIKFIGGLEYNLTIYNRWGEKVFISDNRSYTWDGTHFNDGKTPLPAGVYYFTFNYKLIGGKPEKAMGTVTLIR